MSSTTCFLASLDKTLRDLKQRGHNFFLSILKDPQRRSPVFAIFLQTEWSLLLLQPEFSSLAQEKDNLMMFRYPANTIPWTIQRSCFVVDGKACSTSLLTGKGGSKLKDEILELTSSTPAGSDIVLSSIQFPFLEAIAQLAPDQETELIISPRPSATKAVSDVRFPDNQESRVQEMMRLSLVRSMNAVAQQTDESEHKPLPGSRMMGVTATTMWRMASSLPQEHSIISWSSGFLGEGVTFQNIAMGKGSRIWKMRFTDLDSFLTQEVPRASDPIDEEAPRKRPRNRRILIDSDEEDE